MIAKLSVKDERVVSLRIDLPPVPGGYMIEQSLKSISFEVIK